MQIIKIECPSCGATPEVNKDLEFGYCMYCGTKIYIPNAVQKIRGTVSIDKSSETENLLKRAGQINNLARGVTAIGTLGMSNIVWKKSKPRHHHEILSKKICICQNCGRSWEMKN